MENVDTIRCITSFSTWRELITLLSTSRYIQKAIEKIYGPIEQITWGRHKGITNYQLVSQYPGYCEFIKYEPSVFRSFLSKYTDEFLRMPIGKKKGSLVSHVPYDQRKYFIDKVKMLDKFTVAALHITTKQSLHTSYTHNYYPRYYKRYGYRRY